RRAGTAPSDTLPLSDHPPRPAAHALSLHDALPISGRRLAEWHRQRLLRRQQRYVDGVTAHRRRRGADAAGRARDARRLADARARSEEHTSELQSQSNIVCRLLLEKKTTPPTA